MVQAQRLIAERGLTQVAAAKLIEKKQPDLSKLLRGQLRLVSGGKADADAHRLRSGCRDYLEAASQTQRARPDYLCFGRIEQTDLSETTKKGPLARAFSLTFHLSRDGDAGDGGAGAGRTRTGCSSRPAMPAATFSPVWPCTLIGCSA